VLTQLLTREYIQFKGRCENWQEALNIVANPLLQSQKINLSYLKTITQNIQSGLADYIILRPGFALPHARAQDGAYETGMSLLKLNQPVYFNDDETLPLYVIVMLATVDAQVHLFALSELITCVAEDADFNQIKQMKNEDELIAFIAIKARNEKERR